MFHLLCCCSALFLFILLVLLGYSSLRRTSRQNGERTNTIQGGVFDEKVLGGVQSQTCEVLHNATRTHCAMSSKNYY